MSPQILMENELILRAKVFKHYAKIKLKKMNSSKLSDLALKLLISDLKKTWWYEN